MANVDDLLRGWKRRNAPGAGHCGKAGKDGELHQGLDLSVGIGYGGRCNAETIP